MNIYVVVDDHTFLHENATSWSKDTDGSLIISGTIAGIPGPVAMYNAGKWDRVYGMPE